MTYEEKVLALIDEGGYSREEAEAMLEDMGEGDDRVQETSAEFMQYLHEAAKGTTI